MKKKVQKSRFLTERRRAARVLVDGLLMEYRYASLLMTDVFSYRYGVNRSGITASENNMVTDRGFVARVYDGRGYAEYSFNELSEELVPTIIEKIRAELIPMESLLPGIIEKMERRCTEDEPAFLDEATEYEIHPKELGTGAIVDRLAKIREAGLAAEEGLIDVSTSMSYQEIHKIFLSGKRDLEQNLLCTCGYVAALAPKGGEIVEGVGAFSVLGGAELLDRMEKYAARSAKTAKELVDSEPLPPGEYECICTPSVTGMIVHEAFGHGVEMDMFVKDRACARNVVGQQVASPLVTMHDAAAGINDSGTYFFDDEGTVSHDTVIIKDGVLVTGMSDLLSAYSLGTEPTGNGRRQSFDRKAYTRMTNTYFEGGSDSVEDMIASVKYGLLLDEPTSGMEDPKNWGIQCMVSFAREIKDGQFTGRIFSPIILTGYVPDLLKSISMMSPAVETCGSGYCGKGYKEWVKVSDGGPYIKARIRLG